MEKRYVLWMYYSQKIGEIIGGSQREEDYEKPAARAKEMGVPEKDICYGI